MLLLLGAPALAGDLGPADLAPEQMSAAFPTIGTQWKAWCGSLKKRVDCSVELGAEGLVVDGSYQVPYASIVHAEKWDSMMAITRLAKPDPAWAGWENYRRSNHVNAFANTALIQYRTKNNSLQTALFSFPTNRVSDSYGFGNAMRLIALGARPSAPPVEEPSKAQ